MKGDFPPLELLHYFSFKELRSWISQFEMFRFLVNCIRSILRWIFGIRGEPVRQNHVVDVELFHQKPFETVRDSVLLDEERNPHFRERIYCPVDIGEILGTRYQVLGKLGWGSSATVWFGRDTWYDSSTTC